MAIELTVNGVRHAIDVEAETPLLYVLRNDLKLKGTRFGCGSGLCGACTVMIDGKAVQACDLPVSAAAGTSVTTIEGLGSIEKPHPLQEAFINEQAGQCGFCLSGIIMSTQALIASNPQPTEDEIREALARNLCRCGTHQRILRAIRSAIKEASK